MRCGVMWCDFFRCAVLYENKTISTRIGTVKRIK